MNESVESIVSSGWTDEDAELLEVKLSLISFSVESVRSDELFCKEDGVPALCSLFKEPEAALFLRAARSIGDGGSGPPT